MVPRFHRDKSSWAEDSSGPHLVYLCTWPFILHDKPVNVKNVSLISVNCSSELIKPGGGGGGYKSF